MKILVACEESQAVTKECRKLGHEAYSCDIIECSGGHPEWHIQANVIDVLKDNFNMIIAFPPCTYLTVSAARWLKDQPKLKSGSLVGLKRRLAQKHAAEFFKKIYDSKCKKVAIENPVGYMSTYFRKPDQIINPFEFGENSTKKTCLWLKGLPLLKPTNIITPETHTTPSGRVWDKWFYETSCISNRKERSKVRSKTFPGIAKAMAEQWAGKNER